MNIHVCARCEGSGHVTGGFRWEIPWTRWAPTATHPNSRSGLLRPQPCPDCGAPVQRVVYAANGESPLDFLPYKDGKPLPGGFKLGINPGLVKHEGTQSVLWGEEVRERFDAPELNLARYIKDGQVTDKDSGE